jgi:MFS family permease
MMTIYLVALASTFCNTAFGGSRVVLSLLAIELGANPLEVGMLAALYALCPMLLAIYAGKVIDRIGARKPMLAGALGIALCLLLPAGFPKLAVMYCVALVLGVCFMMFFVAVTGVTGAIGRPEDRTRNYSLLAVGFSISGFIGPLVAGFSIDYLGHQRALVILAAFTLVPILLLWLKPELIPRASHADNEKTDQSVLDLLRMPALRRIFIIGGFISAGWDLYSFYLPVYGRSIGLSASVIGMILAAFALATCVIRLFLAAMVKRGSELRILNWALYVASAAYFLFPFFANPWALAAISFLLGLGIGTGQPLTMNLIYNLAPQDRTSEAAGVRVTVNHVIHVTVPLLFGAVGAAFGFLPVFVANGLLLLTGGIANQRAVRH